MRYVESDFKPYILVVNGERMHSTSGPEFEQSGQETLARLQTNHPESNFNIKPFMARISGAKNNIVGPRDWHKEKGWSIWYTP